VHKNALDTDLLCNIPNIRMLWILIFSATFQIIKRKEHANKNDNRIKQLNAEEHKNQLNIALIGTVRKI